MENNESQSPQAGSGKNWPEKFSNINPQLLAGLLIVVLLAIVFMVFKPGGDNSGLDKLTTYNDMLGKFTIMIPQEHSVLEEGQVFTVADPIEDDAEDRPMWSISVLPLIAELTENSEKITEDSVDTYVDTFIESYKELAPEGTEGAPTKLVAEKVENENSVHSVAIQGTYFQDNEDGLNLYHRDLVIFDDYGNSLVFNFLMPADDYTPSLDDEIDAIANSLQFVTEN